MVSTYEYLLIADLEKFTGIDYSTIDAVRFADVNIYLVITAAEEIINAILGVSVKQTVTNAISLSTKLLSAWMMNQRLKQLGYTADVANPAFGLTWQEIITLVRDLLSRQSNVGVDSIPMSGADRTYSTYRGSYY